MKSLEIIKAGMPTEIQSLDEEVMDMITGGVSVACQKGYDGMKQKCGCGYIYNDDSIVVKPDKPVNGPG